MSCAVLGPCQLVLALWLAEPATLGAQPAAQRPARDARLPTVGTAQIAGRVSAADTGAPLRQVQVMLVGAGSTRIARTDQLGQYRFADLPAGSYRLQAGKPGFVTLRYGVGDPLEPARPVNLRDGEVSGNINFTLPRAAVVAGQIVDEFGEPVLDARVRAMRYQSVGGQRRLTAASRVRMTDDQGSFRIFGLLPGTYYISALPPSAEPSTETDGEGSYAATYYPGTLDASQATAVKVQLGEEVRSITFSLVAARTARVAGSVVDSRGQPVPGANVTAVKRDAGGAFVTAAETRARPDGAFEFGRLAPGSYSLQAFVTFRAAEAREPEFGATPVEVGGGDLNGVAVHTKLPAVLGGRVVAKDEAQTGARPFRPTYVEITARPVSGDVRFPAGRASTARVNDDWTFELRGLSGPRLLRVSGVPAPWALDAVYLNGRDVTDTPIELKEGSVSRGIQVVLTTRATELSGTVDLSGAAGARQVSVIVFPSDASKWTAHSRQIQIRRPDAQGRFRILGLPPGGYMAAAVPYVWQGEWSDAQFLEKARLVATALTLGAAEKKTVQLRLAALP